MQVFAFDENISPTEFKKKLQSYRNLGFSWVWVNKKEKQFLCSTTNIEGAMKQVFPGLSEEEMNEFDNLRVEQVNHEHYLAALKSFEEDQMFNFYLGQARLYVKEEKRKEFEEKVTILK